MLQKWMCVCVVKKSSKDFKMFYNRHHHQHSFNLGCDLKWFWREAFTSVSSTALPACPAPPLLRCGGVCRLEREPSRRWWRASVIQCEILEILCFIMQIRFWFSFTSSSVCRRERTVSVHTIIHLKSVAILCCRLLTLAAKQSIMERTKVATEALLADILCQ